MTEPSKMSLEEKMREARKLYQQGYTYRQIAKMLHISSRDIARALRAEPVIEPRKRGERLERIEKRLEEIERYFREFSPLLPALTSLFYRFLPELSKFKAMTCKFVDNEGFCRYLSLDSVPYVRRDERGRIIVNVRALPYFCSICPREES